MRYELNHNGEIVQHNTELIKSSDIENKIQELFSINGHKCNILNKSGSLYEVEISNIVTGKKLLFDIYYGNVRNESRNPKEKKIQLNSKDPRNSTNAVIILGFYCFNATDSIEKLLCATWTIDETTNYPSNPSIRGINIDLLQEAFFNGLVVHQYRNNTVCIFKSNFIHFYLQNKDKLHLENYDFNTYKRKSISIQQKIFYGAPGTGKSYKVNEIIAGVPDNHCERITFHPEYDYASFVGTYKPTMREDDIRYEFVPQTFANIYVKAWNDLENDYYLIIEEINRGNCAEIFGDIFQLLDRNTNYPISPSKELLAYLKKALNNTSKGLENDKILLPPNLHILATMNTSDQSLFPMDSAFKRRWEWEYVPINYEDSEDNPSSNFKVYLSDTEHFSWLDFIKKVNEIIKNNENLGMDKCIGNYFIKPEADKITPEIFINKAVFYLWNDVFKDEPEDQNIFRNKTNYEDFFPINSNGIEKLREMLELLEIEIKSNE